MKKILSLFFILFLLFTLIPSPIVNAEAARQLEEVSCPGGDVSKKCYETDNPKLRNKPKLELVPKRPIEVIQPPNKAHYSPIPPSQYTTLINVVGSVALSTKEGQNLINTGASALENFDYAMWDMTDQLRGSISDGIEVTKDGTLDIYKNVADTVESLLTNQMYRVNPPEPLDIGITNSLRPPPYKGYEFPTVSHDLQDLITNEKYYEFVPVGSYYSAGSSSLSSNFVWIIFYYPKRFNDDKTPIWSVLTNTNARDTNDGADPNNLYMENALLRSDIGTINDSYEVGRAKALNAALTYINNTYEGYKYEYTPPSSHGVVAPLRTNESSNDLYVPPLIDETSIPRILEIDNTKYWEVEQPSTDDLPNKQYIEVEDPSKIIEEKIIIDENGYGVYEDGVTTSNPIDDPVVNTDPGTDPGTDPVTDPPTTGGNVPNSKPEDQANRWKNLVTTQFPFSLPWDMFAVLSAVNAEPTTPIIGVDENLNIFGNEVHFKVKHDLSWIDPYMPFFRSLIILSFIIFLIFATSKFFGGAK